MSFQGATHYSRTITTPPHLDSHNTEWRAIVLDCLYHLCLHNAEFTVDTLREACDLGRVKAPRHCNAWGAIFTTAARLGWITKTGCYTDSIIPRSRGRMVSVWRSNLNSQLN